MGAKGQFKGEMTREAAEERLTRLAGRIGIKPSAIKVRRAPGQGMRLTFDVKGNPVHRQCTSQGTIEGNLACLVLWLNDLVVNVERSIDTFSDAFYSDGLKMISSADMGIKVKLYKGNKAIEDSLVTIERSLKRLGISRDQAKVKWGDEGKEASIQFRLPMGQIVRKVSVVQVDTRCNMAALALWLQARAKNVERGIETDLKIVFAAQLEVRA